MCVSMKRFIADLWAKLANEYPDDADEVLDKYEEGEDADESLNDEVAFNTK